MEFLNTVLGIELGSTRIKAVLLDRDHTPIASGCHEWENRLANGIWTYSMGDIHSGVQACYADLKRDVVSKYGQRPTAFGAIGVSAMMHGYLPFDRDGGLLTEFRTWRNIITVPAAAILTQTFGFNIPHRWSIAHLYQAMLSGEEHVSRLDYLTTLSGYLHWKLTGERVIGIGDASGMFPIDSAAQDYDRRMVSAFDALSAPLGCPWKLRDVLPAVRVAGESAGRLTAQGAAFLDPEGDLRPGVPFAPCEGDAGTGMVATNSVRAGTGNISAGTSDFAMLVTDRTLGVHREIDMVTTPAGLPVAMVHCNNCTSDINAWVGLFEEFAAAAGVPMDSEALFSLLFRKALEGDGDCGGLMSYNYFSGESITGLEDGRPVFARMPNCSFTLANFMRTHLLSALATLKIGLDVLTGVEKVPIEKFYGHGGFFRTPGVGQRLMSAAVSAPVYIMETAGEGGPYGMALLCAYLLWREKDETLEDYLEHKVFAHAATERMMADETDIAGFNTFISRYQKALPVERAAVEAL
jgi:sugar (pentulose or hexulose) kinase